jgi:hypothetical protein
MEIPNVVGHGGGGDTQVPPHVAHTSSHGLLCADFSLGTAIDEAEKNMQPMGVGQSLEDTGDLFQILFSIVRHVSKYSLETDEWQEAVTLYTTKSKSRQVGPGLSEWQPIAIILGTTSLRIRVGLFNCVCIVRLFH